MIDHHLTLTFLFTSSVHESGTEYPFQSQTHQLDSLLNVSFR